MTAPVTPPTTKKPRPKWLKILIVAGAVLFALIIIGAIVGPKKTQTTPAAAASTTSSASTTTSEIAPSAAGEATTDPMASYAADLASRPKPTDAQVRQIGLALVDIQPELAGVKVTQVESWSDSVCGDIWTGVDGNMGLADRAAYRFNGGDRPTLTAEQGQQIVDLIAATYCHQ